ncbi:hypothetical protein RB213_013476 [Colletotrichum asianum]
MVLVRRPSPSSFGLLLSFTTGRAPNLCVSAFPICCGSSDCAHLIGLGAGLLQVLGRYIEMMGSSWTLAVLGVPSAVE